MGYTVFARRGAEGGMPSKESSAKIFERYEECGPEGLSDRTPVRSGMREGENANGNRGGVAWLPFPRSAPSGDHGDGGARRSGFGCSGTRWAHEQAHDGPLLARTDDGEGGVRDGTQ